MIKRTSREHVLKILEKNHNTWNILDIGCGGGLLSEPLSRLGANVMYGHHHDLQQSMLKPYQDIYYHQRPRGIPLHLAQERQKEVNSFGLQKAILFL